MNLNTVKKALPFAFKARVVPCLTGIHGVGKSTAVREYCEDEDIGFIDLRLGQMEVGDLLGLPEITTDHTGHKITVFARPKWFPTEGRGILFLDEINRAKRDVIQAVFQLVLDRRLHDYVLPDGWHVVSAMNPNTSDYTTLDLSDKAFIDRFCHIKITSSYNDFINYGTEKKFNKSILNFINAHPGMLRGKTEDFSLDYVTPSDRSWEQVERLTSLYDKKEVPEDIYNELVVGIVGLEASTAFLQWKKNAEKPVDGMMVLKSYPQVRQQILEQLSPDNYRADLINITKQGVIDIIMERKDKENLSQQEYDNLVAFGNDLTNDLFVDQIRQLLKKVNVFIKLSEEAEPGGRWSDKVDRCLVDKANKAKNNTVSTKEEV